MEESILALLNESEVPADSSKWQSLKVKHDVTSNRKDFPLAQKKVKTKTKRSK